MIVNGKKVFELGIQVHPTKDRITIDGKPLRMATEKVYAMLYKPSGVLTTLSDPEGRPTVIDFIKKVPYRLFPIGRLDWDSEGLILLTNDGEYANRVMNPKGDVTKTYLIKVDGNPTPTQLDKLKRGVPIIGGRVRAEHIERVKRGRDQYAWLKIIITEGKNRQIRQMFEKIGFDVLKLQRVAIGRLRLGALKRGDLVFLNEVAAERVFLADQPDVVSQMKTYKGRTSSPKRLENKSKRIRAEFAD